MERAMHRHLVLLLLVVFTSGCAQVVEKTALPVGEIKTYKDIPGVTKEEIVAIEVLKANRSEFRYGSMSGIEVFALPDGTYDGFTVKYCDLLTRLFGIPFVLELYEWDELIARLESHQVDFNGDLTPSEERKNAKGYFMTTPIAERAHRIFTLLDSGIQTEADIEGRTIAFLEDSVTATAIQKLYRAPFTQVEVADYQEAADKLKSGEVDAFVDEADADPAFEQFDFIHSKLFFPMVHSSVSMTTVNPELAPIISVMDKFLTAGGSEYLFELYKAGDFAYAKRKLEKLLTEEEQAYINDLKERKASVPVAFVYDNYPVCFYNEKEHEFQGIAVEVLAEISRLTDIPFDPVRIKGRIWAEVLEEVQSGTIPMVTQLLPTETRKESFIWSATPYSRTNFGLLSKYDFPNKANHQIAHYSVGVMKQSGYSDTYQAIFPSNRNLKKYDSMLESLDALEKGEVDLLMGSEYALLAQTRFREKPNYKINLRLPVPMNSHFGFNKEETILCSIISKTQEFVAVNNIESRWTDRAFDYSKKMAEQRTYLLAIFSGAVSLILALTVLLLLRNIKLGRQLREVANKDVLTDIYNRRHFMEQAAIQMERSFRMDSKCYMVIYDLDHFKSINDKYGHAAGDKVLKETAQRVKSAIRPYDLFGRYGGEEFILLLLDTEEKDAINMVERLRQAICGTPVVYGDTSIVVSASFGVFLATASDALSAATRYADEALYEAKRAGRNRTVFSDHRSGLEPTLFTEPAPPKEPVV